MSFLKYVLIILGCICCAVGGIGIFVPVLPTTPFFLLATWCFARSSERLHHYIRDHKYVGKMIRNWERDGSISFCAKCIAIVTLWCGIYIGCLKTSYLPWRVLLVAIAVGVTTFIVSRPLPQKERVVSD